VFTSAKIAAVSKPGAGGGAPRRSSIRLRDRASQDRATPSRRDI